jgi:hypothetical protein
MDITLPSTESAHSFIRHPGSDKDFLELVRSNGAPWVDHRLSGAAILDSGQRADYA